VLCRSRGDLMALLCVFLSGVHWEQTCDGAGRRAPQLFVSALDDIKIVR